MATTTVYPENNSTSAITTLLIIVALAIFIAAGLANGWFNFGAANNSVPSTNLNITTPSIPDGVGPGNTNNTIPTSNNGAGTTTSTTPSY